MTAGGLRVCGVGAVSPVGLSAPATFAALRAGIARLGPIETHAVAGGGMETQALVGGRVPIELLEGKPEDFGSDYPGHRAVGAPSPPPLPTYVEDGPARLATMVVAAAEEALVDAAWKDDPRSLVAVHLVIDPEDDDDPTRAALEDAIARAFDASSIGIGSIHVEPLGRAGVLAILARLVASGRVGRVLVGGVGSRIRPAIAAALDARGKVRSADKPLAAHPGECAAFVALEAGRSGVFVASAATADEPSVPPEPTRATGLSTALVTALEASGGRTPRPLVVCDLDGDRYRGIEWGFALTRVFGAVHEEGDVWHPAEGCGDGGAGLGALCLAWGAASMIAHTAGAPRVLVWGASDSPLRSAAVIERAKTNDEPET